MTPSLKKLKASRRPTLWYNEKTDELMVVVNSKHWRADDLVGDDLIGDQKHTAKFNYLTRKIANTWKEIEDL